MEYYHSDFAVEGATSLGGKKYIRVTFRKASAWVLHADFNGSGKVAVQKLADQGVVLIGSKAVNKLLDRVADISDFPPMPLFDKAGWNGPYFAFASGDVFSPKGATGVTVVFNTIDGKFGKKGSLAGWKSGVAEPLTGQPIPMFAIMGTFMPPLLRFATRRGNPGFELVGAGGKGKSTAQLLAASALGGIEPGGSTGCYVITYDTTLNALEDHMALHADLPIVIDEANLFFAGESAAKRGQNFKALAFKMAQGSTKGRKGSLAGETRFGLLSSSNEALAVLIGRGSEVSEAAGDRLLTIPIDYQFGVFKRLPKDYSSASQYAAALLAAAREHHGTAFRRFIRRLVQEVADDEAGVCKRIAKYVAEFVRHAGVDLNDGSAFRIAEAFGLVYAGGKFAQDYGVLPAGWNCGPAVLACYRASAALRPPQRTFAERLVEVAAGKAVVHIGLGQSVPDKKTLEKAAVIVRHRKAGRELLIRKEQITTIFLDWPVLVRQPEVQALMNKEDGHRDIKRRLVKSGSQVRMYSFNLPPAEDA